MTVTYWIARGPATRFGAVAISGLTNLSAAYVEGRLRWQRCQSYDAAKVEETRRALIETGLFNTVRITPKPDPANPGFALIDVDATERPRRTIGAGAGYNTSQGVAAKVYWENRNLFGNAEYLRLSATDGQQVYALNGNFRRPDFLTTRQDFLATGEIANYSPTANHSRRALTTVGVERRFDRMVTGRIGLLLEKADVEELANIPTLTAAERTQRYALIALPAYLKIDTTDNLLSPDRGYRAQFSVTPAHIFSSADLNYVPTTVSTYRQLGENGRAVLAGRAEFATLDGPPLLQLPADQRIYVGGGGTIRAYAYQTACPLASNNDPIGGKSSLVVNLAACRT
jgi:translocation and assembly module TamA